MQREIDRERDRERKRERERDRERDIEREREKLYVCEREKERKIERENTVFNQIGTPIVISSFRLILQYFSFHLLYSNA